MPDQPQRGPSTSTRAVALTQREQRGSAAQDWSCVPFPLQDPLRDCRGHRRRRATTGGPGDRKAFACGSPTARLHVEGRGAADVATVRLRGRPEPSPGAHQGRERQDRGRQTAEPGRRQPRARRSRGSSPFGWPLAYYARRQTKPIQVVVDLRSSMEIGSWRGGLGARCTSVGGRCRPPTLRSATAVSHRCSGTAW